MTKRELEQATLKRPVTFTRKSEISPSGVRVTYPKGTRVIVLDRNSPKLDRFPIVIDVEGAQVYVGRGVV